MEPPVIVVGSTGMVTACCLRGVRDVAGWECRQLIKLIRLKYCIDFLTDFIQINLIRFFASMVPVRRL